MKTVFANSEVCHVWAHQRQPHGRNKNSSIYFEGPTIYSYGYHFPMATIMPDDYVLINNNPYSPTTVKHQASVRSSVSHKERLYILALPKRNDLNNYEIDYQIWEKELFTKTLNEINKALGKLQRARKKEVHIRRIKDFINVYEICYARYFQELNDINIHRHLKQLQLILDDETFEKAVLEYERKREQKELEQKKN